MHSARRGTKVRFQFSQFGDGRWAISISISIWRDSARFPRLAPRLAPIGCDALASLRLWLPGSTLGPRIPPCESRYRRAQLASIGQPQRCARAGGCASRRAGVRCPFLLDPLLLPLPLSPSPPPSASACCHPSIHPPSHHALLLPKLARTPSSTASFPTRHHVERRCCARAAVRRRACRRTTRIRIHRPTLWRHDAPQEGAGICIGRHPPPAAPNLGSRRGCRG